MDERPGSTDDFAKWAAERDGSDLDAWERLYRQRTAEMLAAANTDAVWTEFVSSLDNLDAQSEIESGHRLLMPEHSPRLQVKPFTSALNKAFRIDCLHNGLWPELPAERGTNAWFRPGNAHEILNDLVRTSVYCRFLDGATDLADRLQKIGEVHDRNVTVDLRADENGYYAVHAGIPINAIVTSQRWNAEEIEFRLEVQFATMTQWVLRTLSHDLYERRRTKPAPNNEGWKWSPSSETFKTNYLGHLLHYADGMMVELRDRDRND